MKLLSGNANGQLHCQEQLLSQHAPCDGASSGYVFAGCERDHETEHSNLSGESLAFAWWWSVMCGGARALYSHVALWCPDRRHGVLGPCGQFSCACESALWYFAVPQTTWCSRHSQLCAAQAYGSQNHSTPHIDKLIASGMKFTQVGGKLEGGSRHTFGRQWRGQEE